MIKIASLIPYTVLIISIFFWLYIFINIRDQPLARLYLLFLGTLIAWSAVEMYMLFGLSEQRQLFLMHISAGFSIITNMMFFLFASMLVTMKHRRPVSIIFLILSVCTFIINVFTPLSISGITPGPNGPTAHSGPLTLAVFVFGFLPIVLTSYLCIFLGMRHPDRIVRRQVLVVLIGFIPASLFGLIDSVLFPYVLKIPPQINSGSFPSLIITGFIFIAITRYRFLSDMLPAAARKLFLQISDGVVLCDRHGMVAAVNISAGNILGIAQPTLPVPLASVCGGTLASAAPNSELTINGRTCIVVKSDLAQGADTLGTLIILADITERSCMEAALKKSNEELSMFASVLSHDMREPLRVIANYLDLLKRRAGDRLSADEKVFVDGAVRASVRLHAIIADLLTYARTGHDNARDTLLSMNELFDETVLTCGVIIRETGARVTRDELPELYASRSLICQLLQNIIANALKFRDTAPPIIHASAERTGMWYRFSIMDNGIGFDPQYAVVIFEMFRRLHDQKTYSGTGMGLALCKKIVSHYGGEITAESMPEAGTTIRFTLPAERTAAVF